VDHVTLVMPLSEMVGHPKDNNRYSLQAHTNLKTLSLAMPKIFHGM